MGEKDLLSSLQLHNDYFKKMTDLIPARYYFDQEPKHGVGGSGKFFHNPKEKAPKQEVKDKVKKSSKKRRRLDPDQHRSVTDIQQQMDEGQLSGPAGVASSSRIWREKSEDESESDAMGTGLEDLSDESDADEPSTSEPRLKPVRVESVQGSATIDELREKVRQKIAQLRTKRKAKPLPEEVIPKKVARKEKEKQKKKKEETLKAIKASQAQQEHLEKSQEKEKMVNGDVEQSNSSDSDDDHRVRTSKSKTNSNKKGGISFSQFNFEEQEEEQRRLKTKKKRQKVTEPRSNKDFGRLLKKAELKKQKLAEMKERDPEKAEEMITEDKWKKVMDKAQGVKVKDDVELLKKSIKRKEKTKKRSAHQWEARKARLEEKMKAKQAKRRTNIKAKTEARKSKKVKRLQSKGKLLLQD